MNKINLADLASPLPADINELPDGSRILGAQEVHVWQAPLDVQPTEHLRTLLAEDEVARADRFHFTRDRNHFIVARALLRKLLAAYSGIAAAELQFAYAEKGKPSLAENQPPINFNLAHSGGMAVFAFSLGRELGIDIEFIREDLEAEKIADRFFSEREVETLMALPVAVRKEMFFNCWTRKEAYIKARGEGLSMPLDEFDVSLAPGEPAALLRNQKDPAEVRRWSMRAISVPAGYVAAIVVAGHDWTLKSFVWQG